MAHPERFELPTTWFVARYSIQLSYGCEGGYYRQEPHSGSRKTLSGTCKPQKRALAGAMSKARVGCYTRFTRSSVMIWMASTLYEIIELPDGEFALQRSGEEGEPLVRIEFSEEARVYLLDSGLDVARAMIDAGIEAIEKLGTDSGIDAPSADRRTLH